MHNYFHHTDVTEMRNTRMTVNNSSIVQHHQFEGFKPHKPPLSAPIRPTTVTPGIEAVSGWRCVDIAMQQNY